MGYVALCLAVGLIGGIFSGALGIGGGAIMVPLMVFWFGLTQLQAQGTALAVMMAPVFILAVLRYYAAGNVKVQMAWLIACGFVVGAFVGAHFIQSVPEATVKRAFGVFLILIGIKMALLK